MRYDQYGAHPVMARLGNREMDFVPLWGGNGIVVDTALTAFVLPLLVTLCITAGVRQALRTGRITTSEVLPRAGRLLSHLPSRSWLLGLLLGLGVAGSFTPLTSGAFQVLGVSGLPFTGFVLLKALYTGILGFVITRWVILRQLSGNGSDARGG
jgi:hypothetical protein